MTEQVYFVQKPEEAVYPCIVFKCISSPGLYQTEDKWERWRFYIIGPDEWEVQSISGTLIDSLNRLYGDMAGRDIDFIQKLDESSIEKREDNTFEMYVDFRILYHM
jgi:hypothetical protein